MTHLERLQKSGIRRVGSPQRGFRYASPDGRRLRATDLSRIEALKLPPAWTEVAISPNPRSHLQAVGKDAAGRWQYRYHERQVQKREAEKYERLLNFARALPRLRKRVNADLGRKGLGRDKVMACILRILGTCYIRPGSEVYAAENGSYGLATLRPKHVKVKGETITFDFPGKSGKHQHRELRDRRVARIIRELLKVPGRDVFKFVLDDGAVVDVRRRHINEYIQEIMGADYSAKDFRTWAGTLICACALARAREQVEKPDQKVLKKTLVAAVKEASEHLGNTPAVARASYISPPVLTHFERGRVVDRYFQSVEEVHQTNGGLHCSEKALLELLHDATARH
ncbi:DNA topoisomerase IB [Aggregicoccus sp. 17bor-14]|uniref:DNA topoisomerase IB n=1 Tax=Myxococcaceae TaxID=31 RepID=UPI00129D1A99|nr:MULTISPECIES: DNA topoisomerase IB [Myxococcaceae]MBF5040777.1 DNA topoisomerase IB [Simulacricoccus sp. 17bor-14]MRI86565.1 DNA topoisomerase IB [Aggregicoccus sp. 17bor-14]